MTLGTFFTEFLQRQDRDKKDVAQLLGVHPSAITQFLQGGDSIASEKVVEMARLLGADYKRLRTMHRHERLFTDLEAWINRTNAGSTTCDHWHVAKRAALQSVAENPREVTVKLFLVWIPIFCETRGGEWLRSFAALRDRTGLKTNIEIIVLSSLEHGTIAAKALCKTKNSKREKAAHSDGRDEDLQSDNGDYEGASLAAESIRASYEFLKEIQNVKRTTEDLTIECRACVGWLPSPLLIVQAEGQEPLTVVGTYGRYVGFQKGPANLTKSVSGFTRQRREEFDCAWDESISLFGKAKTDLGDRYSQAIVDAASDKDALVAALYRHFCDQFRVHNRSVEAERMFAKFERGLGLRRLQPKTAVVCNTQEQSEEPQFESSVEGSYIA